MNWTGRSWTLRSNYTGTYLGLDGVPADGTRLVASPTPFEWHIWRDQANPNTFRYVMRSSSIVFGILTGFYLLESTFPTLMRTSIFGIMATQLREIQLHYGMLGVDSTKRGISPKVRLNSLNTQKALDQAS